MGPLLRAADQAATPTLFVLVAMSLVALTVGLERLVHTLRARRRLEQGRCAILGHLQGDGTDGRAAQAANGSLPSHPATALFALLLKAPAASPGEVRRSQSRVVRATRRRLWILGSVGTVAPFVGLMGTVVGIMDAFRAMGAEGAGGFQVVSQGISEALVTTAGGIFVAVEAVMFFNYLQVCIGAYATELRDAVEEIAERHGRA